jgi:hypothetical protein
LDFLSACFTFFAQKRTAAKLKCRRLQTFSHENGPHKKVKNLVGEIDRPLQASNRRVQEPRRDFEETEQLLDAAIKAVADLGSNTWWRFVEELLVPVITDIFKERGIELQTIYQNVIIQRTQPQMAIGPLAIGRNYAVLIEAKSTLTVDDIKDHLERLSLFKKFFPEYKKKKALGAVAGIVIDEGAEVYAYRQGLFLIAQSGETVEIVNDKKFKPRAW